MQIAAAPAFAGDTGKANVSLGDSSNGDLVLLTTFLRDILDDYSVFQKWL
jgi:hypothetical protein